MNKNKFGEIVFTIDDFCDILYTKGEIPACTFVADETSIDASIVDTKINTVPQTPSSIEIHDFDKQNQQNWYMPDEYKNCNIAEYILSKCVTDEQIQRVGKELLLYHEKNLFNLLKYLKYLIDTCEQNNVIWGVGRGSSVASYVLYLLKVHKIDSIYYDLDPEEFLR